MAGSPSYSNVHATFINKRRPHQRRMSNRRIMPQIDKVSDEIILRGFRILRILLRILGDSNLGVQVRQQLDAAERLLKYSVAIRRRELKRLVIFVTDSCHSKCLHCGIWRIKSPVFLPLSTFMRVVDDVDRSVDIVVTGGEPLEHPQIEEMISFLASRRKSFTLLSNGSYPEKLIDLVRRYHVPEVILSCDGLRETYKRMRGVDWFPNVERIVKDLRGQCKITLTYTVSFWNSRKDLIEVERFSLENHANLSVGIHGDCASVHTKIPIRLKRLYPVSDLITNPLAKRYYALYRQWLEGKVFLPCFSVRFTGVVYANEKFGICEALDIIVGDLRERELREIWNDPITVRTQLGLIGCNKCWLTHYRRNDVVLSELMAKFAPSTVLRKLVGDFDWNAVRGSIFSTGLDEDDFVNTHLLVSC